MILHSFIELTCNNCGWVHVGVSREDAEQQVASFNQYFDTLSKQKQDEYYGGRKSSIERFMKCFNCGGSYTNFRDYVDGDCPDGCTMQCILIKEKVT